MKKDDFFYVFLEESRENLQQMEEALLELERNPENAALINTVFRAIHTVKGGAGLMGLEKLSLVAHQLENILDNIRQAGARMPQEALNHCLTGMDLLKQILESDDLSGKEFESSLQALFAALDEYERNVQFDSKSDDVSIRELVPGLESESLQKIVESGKGLYQVQVTLAPGCLLKSVRAYMAVKAIDGLAEVIETSPTAAYLEGENFEQAFSVLAVGKPDLEELQKTVENISEVAEVLIFETDRHEAAEIFSEQGGPFQETLPGEAEPSELSAHYYRIELKFQSEIMKTGVDPLMFIFELAENGRILESYVNISQLPPLEDLDALSLYLHWTLFFESKMQLSEVEDIFLFIRDDSEVLLEEITSEVDFWFNDDKRLGELLVERGLVSPEDLDSVIQKQKRIGELLEEEGMISGGQVEKIVQAQQSQREQEKTDTIRVDTHKLEEILNGVAELLIAQSRIKELSFRMAAGSRTMQAEIGNAFQETDKIIRRLQEDVMNASMIPIGGTFVRFQRMVRDMAWDKGKEVELVIQGRETELDKKVIEQVADPLKHILRNAVDHGLETPQEREALGKPPAGKISLNAFHQEGNIVIEISDDGRGIDEEAVLQKARERGLLGEGSSLSSDEIKNLLFMPGFSTAREVTDISGRGVGLDVVLTNIKNLRGEIELFSQRGTGTTYRIKLPLTLAIIDGMMIRVGQERFIVPLNVITEFIKAAPDDIRRIEGKGLFLQLRNQYFAFTKLYELLNLEPEHTDPTEGILIIFQEGSKKMALLVDEIIGQEQVVIKSIKEHMEQADGIAGATIMGDGKVALILDTHSLFQLVRRTKVS